LWAHLGSKFPKSIDNVIFIGNPEFDADLMPVEKDASCSPKNLQIKNFDKQVVEVHFPIFLLLITSIR
jgi:hypothetical protein